MNLMCKDVKNAKPILESTLLYKDLSQVLEPLESSRDDYTTIVKHIEMLNGKSFQ